MPVKRRKDKTNLLDCFKLKTWDKKHYYHVFVWKDLNSLRANSFGSEDAIAVVNHEPEIFRIYKDRPDKKIIRPKLGEVHITIECFDEMVVAHELLHAMFNRIRTINNPTYKQLEEQEYIKVGDTDYMCEEVICYEFSDWFIKTYRRIFNLWKEYKDKDYLEKKCLKKR